MTTYEVLANASTVATVGEATDDDQLPVHGVILGVDDVTHGLSGKPTRWPADVLESMAEDDLFEGKPITMADSLDPEQHVGVEVTEDGPMLTGAVSMDEKVGEVVATAFDPDVGLLFDGFVADWDAEDVVERGLAQVSPVVIRDIELVKGEPGGDGALYEPTDVSAARDLALVADGAAPSNEIDVGPLETAPGLAEALSTHFGVDAGVEALSLSRPTYSGYSSGDWDAPTLSETFGGDMESARNSATWIADGGETFGDLKLFVVDGDGELNVNALDAAWRMASQTDGPDESGVERLRSLYEDLAVQANRAGAIADETFASVWQDRVAGDIEAGAAATPGGDDGSNGGSAQSTPATNWRTQMSDDLTDKEHELLAAARQKDDPAVVEAEVHERLSDLEEQIEGNEAVIEAAADVDEPEVVDAEEAEAMRERVAIVEDMMAEALADQKGLREATVEAMSFDAMAAEFQTDDGDLDVEALTQTPETGSGPSGGGSAGPTDEDRERIAEIESKLDALGNSLPAERVEALQDEAAELADADDYDGALEVL